MTHTHPLKATEHLSLAECRMLLHEHKASRFDHSETRSHVEIYRDVLRKSFKSIPSGGFNKSDFELTEVSVEIDGVIRKNSLLGFRLELAEKIHESFLKIKKPVEVPTYLLSKLALFLVDYDYLHLKVDHLVTIFLIEDIQKKGRIGYGDFVQRSQIRLALELNPVLNKLSIREKEELTETFIVRTDDLSELRVIEKINKALFSVAAATESLEK